MKIPVLYVVVIFLGGHVGGCTSEPIVIPHELNGVYEGSAYAESIRSSANIWFPLWTNTEEIRLDIKYPSFTKTRLQEADGCKGTIALNGNELEFLGRDCGCSCDCLLLDYCRGDIILGKVEYELRGDSLIMTRSSEIDGIFYKKRIALMRK